MERLNSLLENKTTTSVLTLLLALYAGMFAPALPNNIIQFFDSVFGKMVFCFLIAYVSSRNTQVAIMIALSFVLTLNLINKKETFVVDQERKSSSPFKNLNSKLNYLIHLVKTHTVQENFTDNQGTNKSAINVNVTNKDTTNTNENIGIKCQNTTGPEPFSQIDNFSTF